MVVPLLLLVAFLGGVGSLFLLGGLPLRVGALGVLGLFVLLFVVIVVGVYTVGLSALGGWLGNYLKVDTDVGG